MKKKVLALAGCIAATASTTSIANVLPESLVGLNLGEISSSSFLNQPFKGVIPFLFTSYENSKDLNVKLAPQSIFNEIGAEKHPILSSLNFQITQQNNKPVILISSNQPIQLPFLNFVLEIQGPRGVVYQDYTVLLDPESKQVTTPEADYIDFNQSEVIETVGSQAIENGNQAAAFSSEELLAINGALLLANLSSQSQSVTTQSLKYRVKTGDSLSIIAQKQGNNSASVKTMSRLIFQKNPSAFIRSDVNKIKKGALLILPTASEINGFELARNNSKSSNTIANPKNIDVATDASVSSTSDRKANKQLLLSNEQSEYTVVKGDSLSKITKKFVSKDMSFTKMMNAIHSNNPEAFVNNNKNTLKAGAELSIPFIAKAISVSVKEVPVDLPLMENKVAANTSEQNEAKPTESPNTDQYLVVEEGDTLSYIAKSIGSKNEYKAVPFATMLKAVFTHNPNAFVNGNMTKLAVGAVIKPPPLSDLGITPAKVVSVATKPAIIKKPTDIKKVTAMVPVVSDTKAAAPTDLIKRIRELRKELKQTKDSLSGMKDNLNTKEILLQQKSNQLDSLRITLTKLNESTSPELMSIAAVAVKEAMSTTKPVEAIKPILAETKVVPKDVYRPKSKAEIAKLKRDLLVRQEKTNQQINKITELQDKTVSPNKSLLTEANPGLFKKYPESKIIKFAQTNYAYLTVALLLSLLLVRYRRELYQYTYSAISYDQPTYYPVPDTDKYELKETNINYYDAKMDEDALADIDSVSEEIVKTKVLINPLLVEATEEIFVAYEDQKQIEHCEHLVTELFDDLSINEDAEDNTEWEDIEKVCETYIERIKDVDGAIVAKEDGFFVEEAADFNHMMSDLLESLDKVDKSVKRNNISDEDFPDLLVGTQSEFFKEKNQA
ncbi:MAG: LysM peptidoglycan-binding domain-containing protein [Cocleimonas sp.]